MKKFLLIFLLYGTFLQAQNTTAVSPSNEFSYNEFLGYVKKYHPLVKNADLEITRAQANLMMARGGFDPKIEVDFDKKQFKDKEYYSILNSSFKIPTWYGIEVKAGFDNSEGIYLNPQNTLPNQGLTSFGISVPLGQGLLINQRMADVRKAKMQVQLSQAERKLEAIAVLYDASVAYFNWKRNYDEVQLYKVYQKNAQIRFKGIESLIQQGDKPAIDSVEAGIIVKNRKAEIHPIAGTFKRTGDDEKDAVLAKALSEDKKENSEHVMLVDLARNDLSRNGHDVQVEKYREVQFFSHVIHLVSKVTGYLHEKALTLQVVADTFPAGTLSGAPKHRAMQLIEEYEKTNRAFYGGAIGFMDFEGNFNHAIMIRTFLSKNHQLHSQAGAGIVANSDEESEMQEVYNKLRALNTALDLAETI